jgi:hypothetical protein
MKNKIAHAFAGLITGLMCYALFLLTFILFVRPVHQTTYVMMPFPAPNTLLSSSLIAQFHTLWLSHRVELIAVLWGLPTPFIISFFAWRLSATRSIAWVRRWYVQLMFAGVGLAALLLISDLISSILPLGLNGLTSS